MNRRIGLVASAIAFTALLVTVLAGSRSLGFGRSISAREQITLLILAGAMFFSQALAYIFTRSRLPRANGRKERKEDEI